MRVKEREVQLLRAAAYIRVSTIMEKQEDSFENQKEHFEKLLAKNKQYENAGIYSDYGFSGTSIRNPDIVAEDKKLRVAAYCRVSTDDEEQQTSYTKQKEHYTNFISRNPDWELVDIYADEGLPGTTTKHRKEFQRMMQDAEDGKIDLILTKSISRFARNTVDTLSWIQRLRNLPNPVQVRFEKEGFESFDFGSEMILTIMSAFAQAESRSISDNVKWSLMQNFKNGKPTINLNRMIGYDMGENGEWLINEEQAKTVREIYNMYLCGVSAHRIAALLNDNGTYTINHKNWTAQSVLDVLRNEKYVGDLTMQKTITVDMLTHKVVKNKGIAKQFHIKDHHAPIIERSVWDKVQALVERNTFEETRTKTKDRYAVLSNLYCGVCGKPYLRQRYSSKVASLCTDEILCKFGYPILKCAANSKTDEAVKKLKKGNKRCESEYLHECAIYQSFMEKLSQIKSDIKANDDEAEIVKSYYVLCMERAKESNSIFYRDYTEVTKQIEAVKSSIKELTDNQMELAEVIGEVGMFGSIISDYESELKELEKHKEELITKIILADPYVKQFEYFVDSVSDLPDIPSDNAFLIPFNKAVYLTFIEKGVVNGDVIEYTTRFGIVFKTSGNMRKMADFIDYRKTTPDGKLMIIEEPYQVYDHQLQFRKKKTG